MSDPLSPRVDDVHSSSTPVHMTPASLLQLLDISPDALLIVDQTGSIVMANEQTATLFGYSRQELQGQPLAVLLPERFRAAHAGHMQHYFIAPRPRPMGVGLPLSGKRKDGTEFPVDISLGPLLLDGQPHVVAAIRDMTEKQHPEHAETLARLSFQQQILDALPCSVYLVVGSDARLLLANHAACNVWGAEWPVQQPMLEFLAANGISLFDAQGHPLPPEQFATLRAVLQGETVRQQQETIRRPDGSSLPVLVNAVPLNAPYNFPRSPDGSQQHVKTMEPVALVVYQDVTALKEAEYLKDEFLGIAAHELRTPLAALKGFADMLLVQTQHGHGPALADWQNEALEEIELATKRLVDLTEELLDLTRLQAGQPRLHRSPTNVIPLVQRVASLLQQTTTRHQVEVHSDHTSLVADIDSGRIEQVLTNLIGNAIKYSPEGGPVIITIREESTVPEIKISVQDRGISIPKHQQAQVFGRFMRADNAQAWGISGTGLGLYLSRELAEQHGGHLWFESEESAGSNFFLTLPLVSAQQENNEPIS